MSELKTHTHSRGLMTEVLAFGRANKVSKSIKAKILQELEQAGEMGLTPDEFVEMHGGLINTIRRRFTDLWKAGQIRHHPRGLTRKNPSGNACVTWVLGVDPSVLQKPPQRPYSPPPEAVMSEYIRGFDAGCNFLCHEIEQYIRHATSHDAIVLDQLLTHLKHTHRENP
jgi:hypothetical protein